MSRHTATLIGLCAIFLWGAIVGMLRMTSTALGPVLAVCVVYTLSAIMLLGIFGFPKISAMSKKYLLIASVLFVSYELCLSFSITYAQTSQQAIEVSIINYLWPSLTMLFLILFKEQKFHYLIIPGMLITLAGVIQVQAADNALSLSQLITNISSNPVSYTLAFVGAFIWAAYCVITKKMSDGKNAISLFFVCTAITLWLKYLWIGDFTMPAVTISAAIYACLAACAFGLGYAAWNIGILHGNITLLTTASYFTPIVSSIIGMIVLDIHLTASFWQGTIMVTAGSLICWLATRNKRTVQ
jgi:drug/metabolite transporter (DMT)-like permease